MSLPAPAANLLPGTKVLSRPQKATIIVRLLQSEGVDLSLSELPEKMQMDLAQEMSEMRYVSRTTLQDVVSEFIEELSDLGLTFPRGVPRIIDALQPSISEGAATKLRKSAGVDAPDNPWEWISGIDTEKLVPLLEVESIEVAAVALSKLNVTKAADIIGMFPGERARKIAYMMSRTGAISPDVVQRIGNSLVAQLQNEPPKAFEKGPADRVGSILNYARAATREDVLEGLRDEDEEFAEAVRKAIFTFKDIKKRIDARDVPKIVREVEAEVLVTAFAAAGQSEAEAATMEFMLENMSQRVAAQLRDDMEQRGKVKGKEGEDAMNAVIAAIRLVHENGDLDFKDEDEAEPADG